MPSSSERTDRWVRGALIAAGVFCIVAATVAVQLPASAATAPSGNRVTTRPAYSRVERVPDELLDDSRRSIILLPTAPREMGEDAVDRSQGTRKRVSPDIPLLPEGYVVASREARIEKEGEWFVAHVARIADLPDCPPLRILPNQQLAMLQAVMAQPSAPSGFLITGRITEFLGANYILVESIEEVISTPPAGEPNAPAPAVTEPESQPTGQPGQEPTAEEILQKLLSRPTRRSVALPQLTQTIGPEPPASSTEPSETSVQPRSFAANLFPEHAMLVDRVGRVMPGEQWWSLVFENRGRQAADKPIRLLPSRLLESAISLSKGGTQSAVFIVSGEVTTYENNNYLLLRKVLLRRQVGNFR